jgi:hypothetical protein
MDVGLVLNIVYKRAMWLHLFEIITIGLPFCSFKIVSGLHFDYLWLIMLGHIDLALNLVNLVSLMLLKKRILPACLFAFLVVIIKRRSLKLKDNWLDLGNSIDVVFSFILVAIMIGSGQISNLTQAQLYSWNISVIFNVLGAGVARFSQSLKHLKSQS